MLIGITGQDSAGKTIFFKLLAKTYLENFSSTNLDIITLKIKDERIPILVDIFKPPKITYPEIPIKKFGNFKDKKTKEELKKTDLVIYVVGAFKYTGEDFIKKIKNEIDDFKSELILDDYAIIENRLNRLFREHKKDLEYNLLLKLKEMLEKNIPLNNKLSSSELRIISSYSLISLKPVIIILNCDETNDININEIESDLPIVKIFEKFELELFDIEKKEERDVLRQEFNIKELTLSNILLQCVNQLGLITFYTCGENEVRGWHIKNGLNAQETAGKIHTDMARGFIRAETINYVEFLKYKDMNLAKKHGVLRQEGKEYIVKDGDIITFKFNV
jgi:ribosome-binding ATPase YchF (GTP1/OBG family)